MVGIYKKKILAQLIYKYIEIHKASNMISSISISIMSIMSIISIMSIVGNLSNIVSYINK